MKKIDDKISEKVTSLVTEYICSSFEVLKNNELWKKAIKKACEATEGVDDSFADYIIKSPAIQRHFVWIMGNKSLNDLYRSFILTIAVERCAFNDEKKLAISLGMAILDNWFELNNEDYHDIIHFLRREMLDFTAFPVFFVSNLLLVQRKKYYFNRAMVSRNCSIVL